MCPGTWAAFHARPVSSFVQCCEWEPIHNTKQIGGFSIVHNRLYLWRTALKEWIMGVVKGDLFVAYSGNLRDFSILVLSGEQEVDTGLFGCGALSCTIRFLNFPVFPLDYCHWVSGRAASRWDMGAVGSWRKARSGDPERVWEPGVKSDTGQNLAPGQEAGEGQPQKLWVKRKEWAHSWVTLPASWTSLRVRRSSEYFHCSLAHKQTEDTFQNPSWTVICRCSMALREEARCYLLRQLWF